MEKKLLLIVEDDKILLNAMEELTKPLGHKVLSATDGEVGLQLALQEHPDLIILDILLPKMDGLTLFKKLREDTWGKNAKVVVFTSFDTSDMIKNVLDQGAALCLVKGETDHNQLVNLIASVLDK